MTEDFEKLLERAKWSDAFFNFDDAYGVYGRDNTEQLLNEAADSFLRLHPTCPYPKSWLVKDYLKRI
jgi:hypothetical protein